MGLPARGFLFPPYLALPSAHWAFIQGCVQWEAAPVPPLLKSEWRRKRGCFQVTPPKASVPADVSSLAYSELNPGPDNGDAIDCLRPSGWDTPLKQWVGCHLVHTDRRSGRAWLPTWNLKVTSEREKVLGKQIPNYPVSAPNLTHTAPASQFFDF